MGECTTTYGVSAINMNRVTIGSFKGEKVVISGFIMGMCNL